jgi:1-acyl-sn-glycerol-3-phosphate acyltransferase
MNRFGQFPLGLGTKITFQIHKLLKISDYSFDEIFEKTEEIIKKHIN